MEKDNNNIKAIDVDLTNNPNIRTLKLLIDRQIDNQIINVKNKIYLKDKNIRYDAPWNPWYNRENNLCPEIENLIGLSIIKEKTTVTYKSLYFIFEGISDIWSNLLEKYSNA